MYLGANCGHDPFYAEKAEELGRWIGEKGCSLVYGGSKIGLMGILARSAQKAGVRVTGVEPQFFIDSVVQLETLDELIVTKTISERKVKMIERGAVFIAFPGGNGTLEEIAEIMSLLSLDLIRGLCIIYNLRGFYDPLKLQLDRMTEAGFITPENRAKYHFCADIDEIEELVRTQDFFG